MELHTLGVDGGYTQKDVTEVARVFTGWTIRQPRLGGGFAFEPRLHDSGEKIVLGHRIAPSGIQEGEQVLDILAGHPSTARFIATKLARRFVSDNPPPALVERAASRFRGHGRRSSRGHARDPDVARVPLARGLSRKDENTARVRRRARYAPPASSIPDARPLVRALQGLGMPLYQCQPPTGYKDSADAWTNAGALVGRMNFALTLASPRSGSGPVPVPPVDVLLGTEASETTRSTVAKAANPAQALALALGSPEFQKR